MGDSVPFSFTVSTQPGGMERNLFYNSLNPSGTIYINWGNDVPIINHETRPYGTYFDGSGPKITYFGDTNSSKVHHIDLQPYDNKSITGITGTFPTTLKTLFIKFNQVDPSWTIPNIEELRFFGRLGPSSIVTGSNLITLDGLPPNLKYLDVSASTKLTELLPPLPSGLTGINLSGDNAITQLDLSACTALTVLPTLPNGLTTLRTPPGITYMPLSLPSSLVTLNLTPPARIINLLLSNCINMTVFPTLPSGLKFFSPPPGITELANLPSTLVTLSLISYTKLSTLDASNCTSLESLPTLPASLKSYIPPPGITGFSGIPAGILSLDLSRCSALTLLPTLPNLLTTLKTPPGITSLPSFPNTLKGLDLKSSTLLTSYGTLPSGLQYLTTPPGITGLSGIPNTILSLDLSGSTGLRTINLTGCNKLTTLPALSSLVTSLNVSGCSSLTTLPILPSGVVTLDVSGCSALTTLPALPSALTNLRVENSGLTGLDLRSFTSFKQLPTLPSSLQYLSTPPGITGLPSLPVGLISLDLSGSTGIRTINLSGCNKLTTLPSIPSLVTSLNISGCSSLTSIPSLPSGVVSFAVSGCSSLTSLPSLPTGVTTLDVSGCSALSSLPSLHAKIVRLNASGCNKLTTLPTLPSLLTSLNISGCSGVTSLPALPTALINLLVENSGLTRLDLTGTNIATFDIPPRMLSQLTYLKLTGSKVKLSGLLNYQIPDGAEWILY